MKGFFKTTTLAASLALAATLIAPTPAAAQIACAEWDVSQGWYGVHGDYNVRFLLQQQGTSITGTADYTLVPSLRLFGTQPAINQAMEPVTGTLIGDSIQLVTSWGGVYLGWIDATTSRIEGFTYDQRDPSSRATWKSDRSMSCRPAAAPVPPPPAPVRPGPLPASVPWPGVELSSSTGSTNPTKNSTKSNYVAAAQTLGDPLPPAAVTTPTGVRGGCKQGYVWRKAISRDRVCVTPKSAARVVRENSTRDERVQPGGGAYGPMTCRIGFVWREAFRGDRVCVTPQIRALVAEENRLDPSRRAR